MENSPRVMATLRNTAISLLRHIGVPNIQTRGELFAPTSPTGRTYSLPLKFCEIPAILFLVVNDRLTAACAPAERSWPDLLGISTKGPASENRHGLRRDFDVIMLLTVPSLRNVPLCRIIHDVGLRDDP